MRNSLPFFEAFEDNAELIPTNLVYESKSSVRHVLLIDDEVSDARLFHDSANSITLPVIYNYSSLQTDLVDVLKTNFSTIDRIAFVFHDGGENGRRFLDNKSYFQSEDFINGIVNDFHVKHLDFLACNLLNYNSWNQFFGNLRNVTVGASNDETGNLKYKGDWIMESTHEDVRDIYFNNNIQNYASSLATVLSFSGGTVYIQQNGSSLEYQYNSTLGAWTSLASWPVTVTNTTPDASSVLTISFFTNITISSTTVGTGTLGYFECLSGFITFDGNNNTITVDDVVDYPGLVRNGNLSLAGYDNISIQNINFASINSATVGFRNGWLCYQGFGSIAFNTYIYNCHNTALVGPNDQCGFICGRAFVQGNNVSINSSSAIVDGCSNSASISSTNGGGMIGLRCGQNGGNLIVRNCSNSGNLSATTGVGGIVGNQAGQSGVVGGNVTIENCHNTGNILSTESGGICGEFAGLFGGTVSINKCYNIGSISSIYSGGITSPLFGYDSSNLCSVTNCYNLGAVQGSSTGGICGASVGYTDISSITPNVLVQNCYNWGDVSAGAGGLLGGTAGYVYATTPVINVSNCYNNGTIVDSGSSFAATSLPITPTYTNCYAADGTWSDANAKANLTGYPALIADNPGTDWVQYEYNFPFILSAFDAENYDPNSVTSSANVITNPGVFADRFYYVIYNSVDHFTLYNYADGTLTIEYNNTPGDYFATVLSYNDAGSYDPANKNLYGYDTSKYYVTFGEPICFNKGTKILCTNENFEDVYMPIEQLKPGHLVKTYKHGYRQIQVIGMGNFINDPNKLCNCMYKMKKSDTNNLIDDLIVTGGHAILVDSIGDHEESNKKYYGENVMIDDKYLFVADNCPYFEKLENNNLYTYYHFVLSNDGNNDARYGVWANGVLTETPSLNQFLKGALQPVI